MSFTEIPNILNSFSDPPTLEQTLLIWDYLNNYFARIIAYHWRKEFFASAVTDFIIDERDIETATTLLYGTYDLALDASEARRVARFSKLVELLLVYATGRVSTNINQEEGESLITITDFLDYTGFKISQFFIGLSTILNDIDDIYKYPEGYWTFETEVIDEISSPVSYHFDMDIATDVNFTDILYTLDSEVSQTGWYYLNTEDVFVALPVAGLSSSFVGASIKYESDATQYMDRGDIYYIRIRQKANARDYNYRRFSDIVYT